MRQAIYLTKQEWETLLGSLESEITTTEQYQEGWKETSVTYKRAQVLIDSLSSLYNKIKEAITDEETNPNTFYPAYVVSLSTSEGADARS